MNLIEIEDECDFNKAIENNNVVLFFSSHDCGLCQGVYKRTLQEVSSLDIDFIPIQIEDHRKISAQFVVFVAPTIVILEKGKEVLRESRFVDLDKVVNRIKLLRHGK